MYNSIRKNIINSFPLQFKIVEEILSPCIGISPLSENKSNQKFSKYGGQPFVVKNDSLKSVKSSFSLVCQIDLSELTKLKIQSPLPNNGFMYFFIDHKLTRFTDDCFKVIFIENNLDSSTEPHSVEFSEMIFDQVYLDFFEHYTFPSYQEKKRLQLAEKIDDDDIEMIYEEICEITGQSLEIGHQILGEPQATQGTVKYWWALKLLGFEESQPLSTNQKNQIDEIQDDFVLLLQIDLEDTKVSFANFETGILYFGILQNDLKNKNFEKVVLVYQSS